MKRLKYIFIVLLIGIMQSCDWMDLTPEDQYSIDNYWNSQDQVERFVRGLHGRMRSRQDIFLKMGEFRGGMFDTGLSTPFAQTKSDLNIISNDLSLENPGIKNFGNLYLDIMQINHAIDRLSSVTFLAETEKNYNLGILYGMRAYYYFHLFRTYGGVPKIDYPKILDGVESSGELNTPRSSETEIYDFVKSDIEKSATYFADDNYTVRPDKSAYWNKAATQVLRAEILLWGCKVKPIGGSSVYSSNIASDLQTAKTILLEVKEKYDYLSVFSDVFATTNKDNKEMILCIRYNLTEATNLFNKFLYPEANGNAAGYEYEDGTAVPKADFLNLANSGSAYNYQYAGDTFDYFDAGDLRRDATFVDLYKTGTDPRQRAVLMTKFLGEISNGYRKFTSDWPIYRYMDVVLLLAEVETALGGDPAVYINEVRQRAYGANFVAHKYPHGGESAEDAILEERTKEFIAEGKRWYDIRRMKGGELALQLQNASDAKTKEQHLLWPIDDATIQNDPLLEQTPGY